MCQGNIKIKVSKTDRMQFPSENLQVDPYWNDLYNPPKRQAQPSAVQLRLLRG